MTKNNITADPEPDREKQPFSLLAATYADADPRTPVIERNNYEFCTVEYVVKGSGILKINGQEFHPEKDSIYILSKGSCHSYSPNRNDPWHKYFFVVSGPLMENLMKICGMEQVYYIPQCQKFKHYFEKMMSLNPNTETVHRQGALLFHQFINELSGYVTHAPSVLPPEMEKLKEKLDSSMKDNFNLSDYCKGSEYSEAHLIRIFKQYFGLTPYDYLMSRKIEYAKRLLLYASFSIKEISAHLSFSDQYYFSNYFKMRTGFSPKHYKQKNTEKKGKI